MTVSVHSVGPDCLGACPAAVSYDDSGDTLFLVNTPVLRRLRPQQRRFILAHELGHRILRTPEETLADAFALGLTAGRQRQSLKNSIRAIASMSSIPLSRIRSLYTLTLAVDFSSKKL